MNFVFLMISISRLIVGVVFILGGIVLTVLSFFSSFVFLIYSIPLIVIGIVLLLNKNEDKIEERLDGGKSLNKKKTKK